MKSKIKYTDEPLGKLRIEAKKTQYAVSKNDPQAFRPVCCSLQASAPNQSGSSFCMAGLRCSYKIMLIALQKAFVIL